MSLEPERAHGVIPQEKKKEERGQKPVAMDVLQNQREPGLATVLVAQLAHRTRRRIQEERAVVGLAVVIAGNAEAQGDAQNQQSRRKRPPVVLRIDQWGIKGREIRTPLVELTFEGAQRGVDPE